MTKTFHALTILHDHGPVDCHTFATLMWPGTKRHVPTGGGGDYGAQMLLGRLGREDPLRRSLTMFGAREPGGRKKLAWWKERTRQKDPA